MSEVGDLDRSGMLPAVSRLPRPRRVALGLCICERLLPHYQEFSRREGWGDYPLLVVALDELWAYAAGAEANRPRLRELAAAVEVAIPDPDEFPGASGALDAGVAVLGALQCALDGDAAHVVMAAGGAVDTISQMDGAVGGESPLVAREIAAQEHDLALLSTQPDVNLQALRALYAAQAGPA